MPPTRRVDVRGLARSAQQGAVGACQYRCRCARDCSAAPPLGTLASTRTRAPLHPLMPRRRRAPSHAGTRYDRFPQVDRAAGFVGRSGVYSETPDLLPIFGSTRPESAVCYIVGCNAWGQAIMSALGDMVPAALGFRPYTADEREVAALCTIRRFTVACGAPSSDHAASLETHYPPASRL